MCGGARSGYDLTNQYAKIVRKVVSEMAIRASSLALVHGAANLAGGLWPLVHLDSFEMVFGPKVDRWLVKTVSGLLTVNGLVQISSRAAGAVPTARRLGIGTAAVRGDRSCLRSEGTDLGGVSAGCSHGDWLDHRLGHSRTASTVINLAAAFKLAQLSPLSRSGRTAPAGSIIGQCHLGSVEPAGSAPRWLTGYGVVSLVTVTAELLRLRPAAVVSLFCAMPSLAGVALASRPVRTRLGLVLTALLMSWLGDWVGDLTSVRVKLSFFLLAQLCYVAAFWRFRADSVLRRPAWCLAYGVTTGVSVLIISRSAGSMAPAVLAYGCSIALMTALATGAHPVTGIGAGSFLISDFLIGLTTFAVPTSSPTARAVIKATYLIGQLLIIRGLTADTEQRPPTASR
jgi:uncharacterized membrane protein YhhN